MEYLKYIGLAVFGSCMLALFLGAVIHAGKGGDHEDL